LLSLFRQFG